ncbi:MAG: NHL repeat-containing protein [Melioribacteraceae bacterium]|nr:NHL repeat-containing protein [Melioribacteraceae bacterium]
MHFVNKKYYMLFLLLLVSFNYAQSLVYNYEFGNFKDACRFSYNYSGYFYVSDCGSNEIIKIDTLGNVSKIIGGYGWNESLFDYPIDISTNILNVYVTDYNNNRIQIFDKDLNYISEIRNSEKLDFKYPTSSQISNQGDIFVLDSDNKRILKLNRNGNLITTIGGFDAGSYQLNSPSKFCIDNNSNLYVISKNYLFIFDQFGNGLKKIKLNFHPRNINIINNIISLVNESQILLAFSINKNELFKEDKFFTLENVNDIKDAVLINNKLFVLRKNIIQVFDLVN